MKNDGELVEKEHTFYRGINSTYWKKLAVFKNIKKRKKHERREKVCRIKKEEREIKKMMALMDHSYKNTSFML